jgi:hypothetical protein
MILPTLQQHLAVQTHVGTLASSISELVKLGIDPATEHLIANEEGSLLAALASLQFLCSDLREGRKQPFHAPIHSHHAIRGGRAS